MNQAHRAMAAAATLGAAAAIGLGGCGTPHPGDGEHATRLAKFDEQGVTVTVTVVTRSSPNDSVSSSATADRPGTSATLKVTFTPDRPGFHLYSADLPADGVDGVGRPLTVAASGALHAAGRPTTDVPAHLLALQGADMSVPVYPDGPVTAGLPVTLAGPGPADLTVGYAACSETECLPPVTGHRIGLQVSGGGVTAPT
jgi:hypothetical protein